MSRIKLMAARHWEKLLYAAVFIVSLAFFVVIGLDTDAIKARLSSTAASELGAELKMASLGVSLPLGIAAEEVSFRSADGFEARLPRLGARFLLSSILTASPAVRLHAGAGEGDLYADVAWKSEGVRISMEGEGFPLGKMAVSVNGVPIPLDGDIGVAGEILLSSSLSGHSGDVRLSAENINLSKEALSETFFGSGLLKQLEPRSASCHVILDKGNIETRECVAVTGLGSFDLRVASRLSGKIGNTPLRGTLTVTPSGKGGLLDSLLSVFPKFRRSDGSYQMPLKGTFSNPLVAL